MNRTPFRRARVIAGPLSPKPKKPQPGGQPAPGTGSHAGVPAGRDTAPVRPDRREAASLDPRLAKAPFDRRLRMRRAELLPRPDPGAGLARRVWTWRAGRARFH